METPRRREAASDVTMGQLMGLVAAAAALCALVATIRALDDGNGGLSIAAACGIGYTFYLVYLVWLSFSYFSRMQVLILITATAGLATLAIQAVLAASGWVVLGAILALPILPFALGAMMFRYGGHWAPDPDGPGDTGTLALLVTNKRGRGLTPQEDGPQPDDGAAGPPRRTLRRRTKVLLLIAAPVLVAAIVLGTQLVSRRMHFRRLAEGYAREEERCFEVSLTFDEEAEAYLAKAADPESREVQEYVNRKKILAEQWRTKADGHSAKRRLYEDRWW